MEEININYVGLTLAIAGGQLLYVFIMAGFTYLLRLYQWKKDAPIREEAARQYEVLQQMLLRRETEGRALEAEFSKESVN